MFHCSDLIRRYAAAQGITSVSRKPTNMDPALDSCDADGPPRKRHRSTPTPPPAARTPVIAAGKATACNEPACPADQRADKPPDCAHAGSAPCSLASCGPSTGAEAPLGATRTAAEEVDLVGLAAAVATGVQMHTSLPQQLPPSFPPSRPAPLQQPAQLAVHHHLQADRATPEGECGHVRGARDGGDCARAVRGQPRHDGQ
jgi:hypothetical protein